MDESLIIEQEAFEVHHLAALPAESMIVEKHWSRLKALVLNSITARNSKRLYDSTLDAFWRWYISETRLPFSKAVVQEYRTLLESRGYAPSTIGLHLAAIRKLASEAADNGLLDPQLAAAVCRIRGPRRLGRRVGNWLGPAQAAALIQAPDAETTRGIRDRALLSLAVGCGLRRSEIAAVTTTHLQLRHDRWVIADLIGKNGRVRTVPIPQWVKSRLDVWLLRAEISGGRLFRSVDKAGVVNGEGITSQAVYDIIKTHGAHLALPIAPHDLRRTFAKLAHAGDARLEQIQHSLGHSSVTTTERYLGIEQDLIDAPGDRIQLPLGS